MTNKVKCIRINAKEQVIDFIDWEVPEREVWHKAPGFYKSRIAGYDEFSDSKETDHIRHVMYYKEGILEDPNEIPRYGFLWRNDRFDEESASVFDPTVDNYTAMVGNAIIMSFRGSSGLKQMTPINTPLSIEQVVRGIGEWSDGIYAKIPRFTCILNESFSEPGYEILLRMDNEAEMYGLHPSNTLTKPMRMMSPQIINFAFNYEELVILTGHIGNPEQMVRCQILEVGRPDLRCIAAATMSANKLPQWIQNRVRDYFFEKLVAERFRKKRNARSTEKPVPMEHEAEV